jgi:NTE family protein
VIENENKYYLKFGLHYDEVFHTGLLVNATIKRFLFRNSTVTFDAIIGDKPRYYFNYFIDNGYIPGLGIYSSGMSFDLKNTSGDEFENWLWFRNEAYLQSVWKDKYAIGGGISMDNFRARNVYNTTIMAFTYINPYIFLKNDTQDDSDFPTRGFLLNAEGKLLDITNSSLEKKSFQTKATISINLPVKEYLSFRINSFGGFSFGDYNPYFYQYRYGGLFHQNLGNYTPFAGNYFGEEQTNNFLSASFIVQANWDKKFFISANYDIGNPFPTIDIDNVFKIRKQSFGMMLGYKSPLGQIKINYSTDNSFNKKIFNVILGHWF